MQMDIRFELKPKQRPKLAEEIATVLHTVPCLLEDLKEKGFTDEAEQTADRLMARGMWITSDFSRKTQKLLILLKVDISSY